MQVEISKIQDKDIKKAKEFCLDIFEENNLKDFFSGKREVFFVAKFKKRIVACGGLKELSRDEGLLKRFYVAKEFRGKGLAEKMIKKIKEFAGEKRYKTIVLDVFKNNERAKKFFQKQGFQVFTPSSSEKWLESQHPEKFQFRRILASKTKFFKSKSLSRPPSAIVEGDCRQTNPMI